MLTKKAIIVRAIDVLIGFAIAAAVLGTGFTMYAWLRSEDIPRFSTVAINCPEEYYILLACIGSLYTFAFAVSTVKMVTYSDAFVVVAVVIFITWLVFLGMVGGGIAIPHGILGLVAGFPLVINTASDDVRCRRISTVTTATCLVGLLVIVAAAFRHWPLVNVEGVGPTYAKDVYAWFGTWDKGADWHVNIYFWKDDVPKHIWTYFLAIAVLGLTCIPPRATISRIRNTVAGLAAYIRSNAQERELAELERDEAKEQARALQRRQRMILLRRGPGAARGSVHRIAADLHPGETVDAPDSANLEPQRTRS